MEAGSNFQPAIFRRTLIETLILFLAATALLNSARVIEFIIPSEIELEGPTPDGNKLTWSGQSSLPSGEYFISIGRAQGSCRLLRNSEVIDSNLGTSLSERSALVLGSAVRIEKQGANNVVLECEKSTGSPVRLVHKPYLNKYRYGLTVHLWRIATDVFVPLAICIFFFFAQSLGSRFSEPTTRLYGYLASIAAFAYLFSLVNIPRLFLGNLDALTVHSFLKIAFISIILRWSSSGNRPKKVATLFSLFSIVLLCLSYAFAKPHTFSIYMGLYHTIPLVVLACILLPRSNQERLVQSLNLFPVFAMSLLDLAVYHTSEGAFFAPVMTLTLLAQATLRQRRASLAKEKSAKILGRINQIQGKPIGILAQLTEIADAIAAETGYTRWSIFLDSYLLGASPLPGSKYRRIASSGHENAEVRTVFLMSSDSNDGSLMRSALKEMRPIEGYGPHDGKRYFILPIQTLGSINFSTPKSARLTGESLGLIVEELFPQVNSIIATLIRTESAARLATNLLREEFGPGTHPLNYGVIFADAVGYTQNVNKSKDFANFFRFEYVPSLLRSLGERVVIKDLFGDELFLVVLPDRDSKSGPASETPTRTLKTVLELQNFANGLGAELCRKHGYAPVEFRVGAHCGPGSITVSANDISLTGPVIEAKRCQSRARASAPFVSSALYQSAKVDFSGVATRETYAAKKEILSGFRLEVKKDPQELTSAS
jgi:hypothetical protein